MRWQHARSLQGGGRRCARTTHSTTTWSSGCCRRFGTARKHGSGRAGRSRCQSVGADKTTSTARAGSCRSMAAGHARAGLRGQKNAGRREARCPVPSLGATGTEPATERRGWEGVRGRTVSEVELGGPHAAGALSRPPAGSAAATAGCGVRRAAGAADKPCPANRPPAQRRPRAWRGVWKALRSLPVLLSACPAPTGCALPRSLPVVGAVGLRALPPVAHGGGRREQARAVL